MAAALRPTPRLNPVVEAAEDEEWADWLRGPAVIAGDFGTGWPMRPTPANLAKSRSKPPALRHDCVLEAMDAIGLGSAYHSCSGLAQGDEQHATYWYQHREDRPFHIDHIFTSASITPTSLAVGTWTEFHARSDHAPVLVTLTSRSS